MNTFSRNLINTAILASLPLTFSVTAEDKSSDIETIEVKGELLPTNLKDAANSIAVINEELMEQLGAAHIQDVLQQIGNVNYSSGSSRARFFQIRGIGERSQFVDPVNPSVGVAIDGIDYTGIGNAATLFDIAQVEVFKGPQGTNVGANAMAGFINLSSTETGSTQANKLRVELGNYGLQQFAGAFGGDFGENKSFRISASKLDGDGYIENIHKGVSDTNGFDELAIRAALDNQVTDNYKISIVAHKFDIDNGYDAFSLDQNRTTLSDEPGFDRQDTTAFGVTHLYTGLNAVDLKLFVSNSNSDLDYGYDEDWSFKDIAPGWEYSSTDHYFRERAATQIDFAATGKDKDWVVGLYSSTVETDLQREFLDWDIWDYATFKSEFDISNLAVYGEKRHQLTSNISLSAGLRIENYDGDYSDNNDVADNTSETMVGGHFSATKEYKDNFTAYFRVSRGFKAGGVNGDALSNLEEAAFVDVKDELIDNATFNTETLDNFELGLRYEKDALSAEATMFHARRSDMQVKQWLTNENEVEAGDAPIFVGYLSNVPTGTNYGIETNISYQYSSNVEIYGAFALLETKVSNYYRLGEDEEGNEVRIDLTGRAQAHAPDYQYTVGVNAFLTNNLQLNVNVNGKGEYYYSFSHDEKASASNLVNASLKYQGEYIDVTLWGRNITDEEYGVRGFYFGNDPRDEYQAKLWEQLGEPMVVGVRIDYVF